MRRLALSGSLLLLGACSPALDLEFTASVYGEAFIEQGIPAAEFSDDWAVTFDQFLISVGEVTLAGAPLSDQAQRYQIFDLARPSGGDGFPIGAGAHALTDPAVGYIIAPSPAAVAGNATAADLDLMTKGGHAIHIVGRATRGDAPGVTKTFTWSFATRTVYSACDIEGASDVQLTIHGDHLFYDDLFSADPALAFDLIAAADDGDGDITEAELRALDITTQPRYQVGDLTEITDLWRFIEQQTTTLGHINGEGHCEATRA